MLPLLLTLALAAQPTARSRPDARSLPAARSQPVAPKTAHLAVLARAPGADLPRLRSFLAEAGALAPSLRPKTLGLGLGSLLRADLLDVESLESAGVDLGQPLTLSSVGRATVICFATRGKAASERLDGSLAGLGTPSTVTHQGLKLKGVSVNERWRAGYVTLGPRTCMASGGQDVRGALEAAATALAGDGLAALKPFSTAAAGLTGSLLGYASTPEGNAAFQLDPSKEGLQVKGRLLSSRIALEKARDGDPLADYRPAVPFVASATLSPKGLGEDRGPFAEALRFLFAGACPDCDRGAAAALMRDLAPKLRGSLGLVVTGLDPTSSMAALPRYYLVPHAYLLPTADRAGAAAALALAAGRLEAGGARLTAAQGPGEGPHWSLAVGGREVFVGLAENALYLANARGARDVALAELAKATPGKPAHAAKVSMDGPAAAAALRRLSILDAARSPELALLFALSVEAGPLLRALGPITGHAEPEPTGARFEADLRLKP